MTALIPVKRVRRRVRERLMAQARERRLARTLPVAEARYAEHEAACREKLARGEKIRVAFLVCDASMFSAEPVFAKMKDDPHFDCFIAVVPRVTRGEAFLRATYAKAMDTLRPRYGEAVRALYDPDTKKCEGLEGQADVVFTSIVYEDQSLPQFTTDAMSAYALVVAISYGYSGLFKNNVRNTIFLPNVVLSWRFVLSNRDTLEEWTSHNPMLARNAVVCGYAKMDRYENARKAAEGQKAEGRRVLICPHHSIERDTDGLRLSTFLAFADFFARLPGLYPDVKFVFRPHPLLFPRLRTGKWWGEERTAAYERKMESYPNVEFQRGGDYFRTFAESDALIHDCGSFLAEYFYTGRPQCYLLADEETAGREFLPFGRKLLDATYRASSEKEVTDFIDRVVLGGDDPLAARRDELARNSVCIHYPNAAACVVDAVVRGIEGKGNG